MASSSSRVMVLVVRIVVINFLQVVGGEEASLWIAQQFVADVKTYCPGLRVIACEANRLLSLNEPLGRGVYFSGEMVEDGLSKAQLRKSCVLLISQVG